MSASDGASRHERTRQRGEVRVNVNVPVQVWEDFEDVAAANFRSRSDHLRFLMARAVTEHKEARLVRGE